MTSMLDRLSGSPVVERLGWTLIHFLWQAAILAVVAAVGLRLTQKFRPQTRYLGLCLCLLIVAVAPAFTFVGLSTDQRTSGVKPLSEAEPVQRGVQGVLVSNEHPDEPRQLGLQQSTGIFLADGAPAAEVPLHRDPLLWWAATTIRIKLALPWIVVAWSAGVVWLSVWHLSGWMLAHRSTRRQTSSVGAAIQSMCDRLMQQMGIRSTVRLLQSTATQVPFVVGWLQPVVLLPASLLGGLPPDQIRAILAHELAHIRRHDFLVNVLQALVETCLFYHPAVWWLSQQIRIEREYCADADAAAICGDRDIYARALVSLADLVTTVPVTAVAANGGNLTRRIQHVLGLTAGGEPVLRQSSWVVSAILGLTVVGLLASSRPNNPVQAQVHDERVPIQTVAEQLAKASPGWKLQEFDEQPSVAEKRGYRIVLRRTWKEFTAPVQQVRPANADAGPFEWRHEDWEFVLYPLRLKFAKEELQAMIKWQKSNSPYYTRDVWLGHGYGYEWFTRGTLFGQDMVREKLKLEGGDDRIQLAIDGLRVEDPGTMTANTCVYIPATFGDKAIPYVERAIKVGLPVDGNWRVIGCLAHLQTDQSTDLLIKLYDSPDPEIRRAAQYALIHKPYRPAAKQAYLDMLRRQSSIDSACAACLEFQWKEAVPILREAIAHPLNLYPLSTMISARRTLEGRPIAAELIEAGQTLRQSYNRNQTPEWNQKLDEARRLLIQSDDAEAANMIAIALASMTGKGGAAAVNEAGLDILRQRPRESTLEYLQSLATNISDSDRPRVEKVLNAVRE